MLAAVFASALICAVSASSLNGTEDFRALAFSRLWGMKDEWKECNEEYKDDYILSGRILGNTPDIDYCEKKHPILKVSMAQRNFQERPVQRQPDSECKSPKLPPTLDSNSTADEILMQNTTEPICGVLEATARYSCSLPEDEHCGSQSVHDVYYTQMYIYHQAVRQHHQAFGCENASDLNPQIYKDTFRSTTLLAKPLNCS